MTARRVLAALAALAAACGGAPPARSADEGWEDGEVTEAEPEPVERTILVDLNDSTAEDLTSIPGVGAATAARIIEHRPYASVDDLDRVPGIGLRKIEEIRPYVVVAGAETRPSAIVDGKVRINLATVAELETLPGVGPRLAEAIVKYREGNGPFRTIYDLQRVPGIGPGKFVQLADRVAL